MKIKSLFVCTTPLQSLIAEKIISHEGLDKSDCILIYIALTDNNKNYYYFSKLSNGMYLGDYIKTNRSLATVTHLRKILKNKKFNVYIGSIDDTLVHYVLSFVDCQELVTFDDGTANIFINSTFFTGVERGIFRGFILKVVNYILGNRFTLEKVKSKLKKHYTIYPEFQNVVDRTETLQLLDFKKNNRATHGEINIFLGTMYEDVVNKKSNADLLWEKVRNFIENSNVEWIYIPHPRDQRKINIESIEDSLLIAEEQIYSLREKYKQINLYGFASSAQFNLLNIPGITIYPVYSNLLSKTLTDVVELLSTKSGCVTIDLEKNNEN
ncbi:MULTISPECIES: glycosyltransferase family 52 [Oligella]|uniref:glycosyltransferase family 52 n=1 Tax=Oligella TaxID=90243 RepID=UPI0003738507|nr:MULTISPECIES: glycosyltransferase family 52 [Oligella]OFV45934.1 hypothetical protein HMPREF3179_11780 [Oligella sp. HMSC09E12]SUA66504.1 CMP-N-acetylneuraminate-beta-galactosamide-alpha-2,3-sialyltransferase [Oligella urethralis]